jgi:hypothetical protein
MLKRRMTTVLVATVAALALFSGTAFAHYCTNASKRAGAGNAGVVFIDVSTGDGEIDWSKSTIKLNKQGQVAGGFMDLHLDFNGDGAADMVLTGIYAHAGLPPGALLAAGCGQATETVVPFFEEHC